MDITLIAQVAQLGASGILLVILYFLWQEFKEQNKFIRDQLLQSQAERKVISQELGMTTQEFTSQAAIVRKQLEAKKNLHSNQPN